MPDVSADADPATGYAVEVDGAWQTFGGTSAAAPTWAALVALADSSSSCAGTTVGFANPALYSVAGSASQYSADFGDVVTGNNTAHGVTGFSAGVGYDMASGLGTPHGTALAGALCGGAATAPVTTTTTTTSTTTTSTTATAPPTATTTSAPVTTTSTTPVPTITLRTHSAPSGRVGVAERFTIAATDSAGLPLRYAAAGLPAGLSIDPRTGLVTGVPARAGVAHVTVRITDIAGASVVARLSWRIIGRPSLSGGRLRRNASGRPVLSLTVVGGSGAAPIRAVAVTPARGSVRFQAGDAAVSAIGSSGGRLAASSRVRRGALLITVRAQGATRVALTSPPLALPPRTGATGLIVKITDAAGVVTSVSVEVGST